MSREWTMNGEISFAIQRASQVFHLDLYVLHEVDCSFKLLPFILGFKDVIIAFCIVIFPWARNPSVGLHEIAIGCHVVFRHTVYRNPCVEQPLSHSPLAPTTRYLDFSFLGVKSPQMELSFPCTFVPWNIHSRGVKSLRTFAPVKLSLLRSECPKNFYSTELSFPGTFGPILKKLGRNALQQSVRRRILAMVVGLKVCVETFSL